MNEERTQYEKLFGECVAMTDEFGDWWVDMEHNDDDDDDLLQFVTWFRVKEKSIINWHKATHTHTHERSIN